jgi:hypothetical protein
MHLRLEALVAALAPALRRVHGEIGVAEQLVAVRAGEIEGDSDAHADEHGSSRDRQRTLERGEHTVGHLRRLSLVGEILQQHRELVAAQPGRGVLEPEAVAETIRHRDEQLVAGRVTEAVVDRLEVVQVEEEDRQAAVTPVRTHERVLDPVTEQRLVGELGEGVVERLVGELGLETLVLGDVAEAPDPAHDSAVDPLGLGVAVEGASVEEVDHVVALGFGLGVEVLDLGQERLGIAQLLDHAREGPLVVA